MTRWLCVVCVALAALLAGCAQNAILELSLDLPGWTPTAEQRTRGDALYAFVQIRMGTADALESAWSGTDPLRGFALTADAARTAPIPVSVVGDDGVATNPLRMKIRFCQGATCGAFNDDHAPEARFEFARVFYVGHVTSYALRLEALPIEAMPYTEHIDKCSVRGCVDGDTTTFCHLDSGRHFCE